MRYERQLDYEVLAKTLGLGEQALDAPTDAARAAALHAATTTVAAYLRSRLRVALDGIACEATLSKTALTRRERKRKAYASLSLVPARVVARATGQGDTGRGLRGPSRMPAARCG